MNYITSQEFNFVKHIFYFLFHFQFFDGYKFARIPKCKNWKWNENLLMKTKFMSSKSITNASKIDILVFHNFEIDKWPLPKKSLGIPAGIRDTPLSLGKVQPDNNL